MSTKLPPDILPYDGPVRYYGKIIDAEQSAILYEKLFKSIEWRNDEAYIFGKHFITKRKVAWYGDQPYDYTYSNSTKRALEWTPELLELKSLSERLTGAKFNSCLLNLYHNGSESMAWHSDDEKLLERRKPIASLTFGAERKFAFKHRETKETISLQLEAGSLLVMEGETQYKWVHRLPPTKKVSEPRINLTFRLMAE